MRRGFKAEAEALSAELRQELSLKDRDPLDIFQLAAHLEIPVVALSSYGGHLSEGALRVLMETQQSAFSGITIHHGCRRLVVLNDAHADTRQRSSLAHELAHALLGHPPSPLTNDTGERHYDSDIEKEANWLSGTILIPGPAARHIAFNIPDHNTAARRYQVSIEMLTYRLRVTGALTIAKRAGRKLA
jgi:Zn-dependent peptidase ImmA (M78 family)